MWRRRQSLDRVGRRGHHRDGFGCCHGGRVVDRLRPAVQHGGFDAGEQGTGDLGTGDLGTGEQGAGELGLHDVGNGDLGTGELGGSERVLDRPCTGGLDGG